MRKELIIKRIVKYGLLIGIAILVGILVIATNYTYLCEDDYSFAGGAADGLTLYGNSFVSSLHLAWRYYKTNQGTYLFNFLIHFINPYVRWGLPGFHIYMTAIALLFVGSLYYLIKSIIDDEIIRLTYLFGALLAIFCSCFSEGIRELFLWYTGTLNFTLEFSLSFIVLGIMINAYRNRAGLGKIVVGSILGFLASGGALIVTAAFCSWCLIFLIMSAKSLPGNKKICIPFVASLIGALINALAPGNFARANAWVSDEHSGIGDAIKDTFICLWSENKAQFNSKIFLIVLLAVLLISLFYKEMIKDAKVSVSWMILSWVATVVVQYVSLFPIILGNHESILSAMRTRETYYIITLLMLMFSLTMTGICLRELSSKVIYSVVGIATVAVLCLCIVSGTEHSDVRSGYSFCAFRDITSGNLRDNYALRSNILTTIEMADVDSDVILFLPYYECESTYGMGINENPDNFVNNSIRNWKKIKSLTVYYWGYNWPPAEE